MVQINPTLSVTIAAVIIALLIIASLTYIATRAIDNQYAGEASYNSQTGDWKVRARPPKTPTPALGNAAPSSKKDEIPAQAKQGKARAQKQEQITIYEDRRIINNNYYADTPVRSTPPATLPPPVIPDETQLGREDIR